MLEIITKLYNKYLNPQDIYEENLILLKLLKFFTAIPLRIEEQNSSKIVSDKKCLVYPATLMVYSIFVLFYLLKIDFLRTKFDHHNYLEGAILLILVIHGVISFGYSCSVQYLRMESIIELLKKLEAFDKVHKASDKSFDVQMKRHYTPVFVIIGLLAFSLAWSFFFFQRIDHMKLYVLLIDSLYFVQNSAMVLMIYFYISLVHSISQRFFYLRKLVQMQENVCENKLRTITKSLLDLCDMMKIINRSFGIIVCISIVLIFL